MRTEFDFFRLKISGIDFFVSADSGIKLSISPRHSCFRFDLTDFSQPLTDPIRLFYSDYYPEPDHSPEHIWEAADGPYRWKVFDYSHETVIYLYYPELASPVIISLNSRRLDKPIFINHPEKCCEILKYPMDILLLQYFSNLFEIITVHASGFILEDSGFICLGRSGAGKTTLANLARDFGASIIQDDRLFIRKIAKSWFMLPVPLHSGDHPVIGKIDQVFILKHGSENNLTPIDDHHKSAVFLPHMVHFPKWRGQYFSQIMLAEEFLLAMPFYEFEFLPEKSAIKHLNHEII